MKNINIFIVDYAYGFKAATGDVDYVSKLRCEAALRAFKKYPDAHIVLGAGMKEVTAPWGSLATIIEKFLLEHGVPASRIFRNPRGHDTLSETEAAYDVIQKHGGGKIICATSRFHAPRVFVIWLFRFGLIPSMYTSKRKISIHESLKELFIKVPRDAVRALLRIRIF